MTILEDCANRNGELLTAGNALAKATTNFLFLVLFQLPKGGLITLLAVRADNAIRPADLDPSVALIEFQSNPCDSQANSIDQSTQDHLKGNLQLG